MTDVFPKAKRSEVMSRIRSRGNKETEIAFMRLLKRNRITGWRRHTQLTLDPGPKKNVNQGTAGRKVRPDFVFPLLRVAIFIDGCFWHACPRHLVQPATNRTFWREKLAANRLRDRRVSRALRAKNWEVVRIWEHELRQGDKLIQRIERNLRAQFMHRIELPRGQSGRSCRRPAKC